MHLLQRESILSQPPHQQPAYRDLHTGPSGIVRSRILTAIAAAFVIAYPLAAQERADSTGSTGGAEDVGQDSDPTKPVLFSLRDEFARMKDNSSLNYFIFRFDKLVLEGLGVPGPARGVLTRIDVPVVTSSNPSTTETGLGDVYLQALVAPRIQGNFIMAGGTGLQMPTATSTSLGTGKWIASPAVVPIWFFPREGLAYIKFQDWFSFAGQSNREAIHNLTVTGYILRRISRQWWGVLDTESNTDWLNDGKTWYKSGFLVGWMPTNRVGIWVKGEIPFGQYRPCDWIVKGSVFITRF
jgi:hypothetical protein